jgi:hypothetical protein
MTVRLLGYSERGMVNALCYDIAHSDEAVAAVSTFLSWFDFPGSERPNISNIHNATILVEQSFSDFGDLDLLVLIENKDNTRQAVLIESKVSNDTKSWSTVEDRWDEFLKMFVGGECNTSNLFVQLHRKVRLIQYLSESKDQFDIDLFVPRGSIGKNNVVHRAVDELKNYITSGNVWFGAILPDDPTDLEIFSRDTLQTAPISQNLPSWNAGRWGFLSWRTIYENTKQGWPRTQDAFEWNHGQIFRQEPPIQHAVQVGQVYMWGDNKVYVVLPGQGDECRVVDLGGVDRNYFWNTMKVKVAELCPCEPPALADVPSLPLNGANYIWDCRSDKNSLPSQKVPVQIDPGTLVTVVGASWYTSRVKMAGKSDGPTFRVYTSHLKRPV